MNKQGGGTWRLSVTFQAAAAAAAAAALLLALALLTQRGQIAREFLRGVRSGNRGEKQQVRLDQLLRDLDDGEGGGPVGGGQQQHEEAEEEEKGEEGAVDEEGWISVEVPECGCQKEVRKVRGVDGDVAESMTTCAGTAYARGNGQKVIAYRCGTVQNSVIAR